MPTAFPSVSPGPQALSLIASPSAPVEQAPVGHVAPHEHRSTSETARAEAKVSARTSHAAPRAYHRIAEVRQQQGLSLRTVSRRTGLETKELRRQEDPSTNLTISQLQMWQRALEVPMVDLLEDESDVLSRPVKERAQMVRIMKTVVSLGEVSQNTPRISRLTTMLREQILQLMPELDQIGGWPQCGSRRGADVMGRIFHEPVSIEMSGE